jgi:hypothetical protein
MTQDQNEIAEWHTASASTQYAWNSIPVDMTDVEQSIAAICIKFQFLLDHADGEPVGIPEKGHGVVEVVHALKRFLTDQQHILYILNDERRSHHRDKHNALVNTHSLQPGHIVLYHCQVQNKTSDVISTKLTYGLTGPFIIFCETGSTRYRIQRIHCTLKQEIRFGRQREESAGQLVKIPPYLVVRQPIQGTDTNFTSLQAGSHPHAISDILGIVGYVAMDVAGWLEPRQDKLQSLTLHKHFVSLKEIWPEILWDEANNVEPTVVSLPTSPRCKRAREIYIDSPSLWSKVEASSDKLFFISHVPANSLLPNWYLVNVFPTTDPQHAK